MRRFQLIELEDQPWLPASLRDALTDYLQFMTNLTQPYAPIAARLRYAVEQTGARRIVDLCSGGAGPWLSLHRTLQESLPIKFLLTDKYPNVRAFQRARADSHGALAFLAEPVDAANLLPALAGFRTLFSSFHHFRPAEARAILADAMKQRQGIAAFEATHRSVRAILLMLLTPLLVLLLTPRIRPFRWSRLMWTYVAPLVPLVVLFDGIVSCLRTYTPAELRALTAELSSGADYHWEIGEQQTARAPLPITYLLGYPMADNGDGAEQAAMP